MEYRLFQHVLQNLLKDYFESKKEMARSIGIPYHQLLRLFRESVSMSDMEKALPQIVLYCINQSISPELLFQGFKLV